MTGAHIRAKCTHLDNVRVVQFTQVLDLAHGRHVKAILKLAHFDLLDGDLTTRRELSAWDMLARQQLANISGGRTKKERRTPIYDRIRSLSDFLVFHPFWFNAPSRQLRGFFFSGFEEEGDTAEGSDEVWSEGTQDAPSLLSFCVGPLHCIHGASTVIEWTGPEGPQETQKTNPPKRVSRRRDGARSCYDKRSEGQGTGGVYVRTRKACSLCKYSTVRFFIHFMFS